jgi:DNA-binding NarL/FixJ family response regulator
MRRTANIRVILADDSSTFLNIMRRYMATQTGFELVGEAISGSQALELARELAPDVALVDLAMPEMNGLEVIHVIREEMPYIGVVALTLYDTEEYRAAAKRSGAHAFVPKPLVSTDLLPAIRTAFAAARQDSARTQDHKGEE